MVHFTLHESSGKVLISLKERLPDDLFDEYNELCLIHGASRRESFTVMEVKSSLSLARALRKAGLTVHVDKEVKLHFYEKSDIDDEILSRIQNSPLFKFQKEDAIWLASRNRALLASEMGTGKTAVTIMALATNTSAIVVCPASIKAVWKNEIEKWRPELKTVVCEGRHSFQWPEENEVVIINYDILPIEKDIKIPETFSGTLIADECHYLKSPNSQRTKRFRAIARNLLKQDGRVWLLSGTPLMNQPLELWHVLYSAKLEHMVFNLGTDSGSTYKTFLKLFRARPGTFGGYTCGQPHPSIPRRLGKVAVRRTRKEVMPELPGKLYRTIPVTLDKKTTKVCDRFIQAAEDAGIDIDEAISESAMGKESRTLFEEMSEARRLLATAKIPAMLQLAEEYEEAGEPIIVFSAHTDPITVLGERKGWKTITGSDKAADREESVRQFQAGELKGIACTIKAGGVGITLTRSHQVVFVDMDWTPANNLQAEDRACRIGQTKGVVISKLVADHTLDKKLTWILIEKMKLITAVELN